MTAIDAIGDRAALAPADRVGRPGDGWRMAMRHLRAFVRQPWVIAISLAQPVVWLLLFGALFRRVTEIPGFGGGSYLEFLTPGVVVMTALFSAGWSGNGVIEDIDNGVMDRFLASPVRRGALTFGRLAYQSVTVLVQVLIMLVLALALGARFGGGAAGLGVLVVATLLLTVAIASLSNAIALVTRRQETMIVLSQFTVLPMTFLSSAFMRLDLAPGWLRATARFNPANWAIEASRQTLGGAPDWGQVSAWLGYLAAFALVLAVLATRAFRSYQRSR